MELDSVFQRSWKLASDEIARTYPGQITYRDALTLYRTFRASLSELPNPFVIIESGNLCGMSTVFLASLKKELCPSCVFLSLDPGSFRVLKGQKYA